MTELYESLGISPIVNAAGSVTIHSGSPIETDIALAMAAAAQTSFDMSELQGRASELIADCTGAEAGIVTSGASAGLLLGAAACIAGLDPLHMGKLPDTSGMRNEFIVARSHRNSYDHAVRAAGASLVEVGIADRIVGVGIRDTEPWEIERAITARTAGIFYLARSESGPELPRVVEVARKAGLPVLVDAAAELPPSGNLRRFVAEGADLVVFSGGKALGGPSASGILCGRRRLVASALLQSLDLDYAFDAWQPPHQIIGKHELDCLPRHGIGRSCKVGKEQIVGLLLALSRFVSTDDATRRATSAAIAQSLVAALAGLSALTVRMLPDADGRGVPSVEVRVAAGPTGRNAAAVAALLRAGMPSVRVDTARANGGILMLIPTCLQIADVDTIARAFVRSLRQGDC
ncbi:MAG: selA [Gammaproteobacteria bacterium]|nr:selA [Gammaproteobacteria bacterium]